MKLENQVTNLELSLKLKKLGVKQKSILSWIKRIDEQWVISSYYGCSCWTTVRSKVEIEGFQHEECAAFTASELGEMLPSIIKNDFYFTSVKLDNLHHWGADYRDWKNGDSFCLADTEAETEADSRAKMLIYLIENSLMELQK